MAKDIYNRKWIIENSIDVCSQYEYGVLTLRALHYQLVGLGMTNDIQHYKRVVSAMIDARWDGLISFDQFSDLDRSMVGETSFKPTDLDEEVQFGKEQVRAWMTSYRKNRWENQYYYPEVLIEKKALQGVFEPVCRSYDVALGACKGYPSLTFLNDMRNRFSEISKPIVLFYFGDYDPSGEDIPRSIVTNLERMGVDVDLRRVALMGDQVEEWKLPHAPAKKGDSRTGSWDGIGQVELDAVRPEKLKSLCEDAINSIFDVDQYEELLSQESIEKDLYQTELKKYVNTL